jgi:hypothetical protein
MENGVQAGGVGRSHRARRKQRMRTTFMNDE